MNRLENGIAIVFPKNLADAFAGILWQSLDDIPSLVPRDSTTFSLSTDLDEALASQLKEDYDCLKKYRSGKIENWLWELTRLLRIANDLGRREISRSVHTLYDKLIAIQDRFRELESRVVLLLSTAGKRNLLEMPGEDEVYKDDF